MAGKILLVDDEARLLAAAKRGMRGIFDLHTALGPKEALQILESEGPFAVIVTDMSMPGMSGIEFLKAAAPLAPDSVNIMLTGNADIDVATKAFNEGSLFRYFSKPCPGDTLVAGIKAALRQHQLIVAEKQLLTQTLSGTIKLLTNVLAVMDPQAFAKSGQIRSWLNLLKGKVDLPKAWAVDMAAMLFPIGACTLPPHILAKAQAGEPLDHAETDLLNNAPQAAARLLSSIPRMDEVTAIITRISMPMAELREQADTLSPAVLAGSKLLHILFDLASLIASGISQDEALLAMANRQSQYDPKILAQITPVLLEAAAQGLVSEQERFFKLPLKDLKPGDVLHSNIVYKETGKLVLSKGHELSEVVLERISGTIGKNAILEPILVERPPPSK